MTSQPGSAIVPIGFGALGFGVLLASIRNSLEWDETLVLTGLVLSIAFQVLAARTMDTPGETAKVEVEEEEGVPVCMGCLGPLGPLDDYCRACGRMSSLAHSLFPMSIARPRATPTESD